MPDPTITTIEAFPLDRRNGNPMDENERKYWREEALKDGAKSVAARVPARYRDATVTEPDVADWVRDLIDRASNRDLRFPSVGQGPSLLLVGGVGTGKTWQAYGAVRALCVSGASCHWQFTAAADCYACLRPRHGIDSEEEFSRFARAGLLVLDDLGVAKNSEWTEEINYRLINHRYERELPTLITSNVPPRDLAAALGARVASRLTEMADRVVLAGPDRRLHR